VEVEALLEQVYGRQAPELLDEPAHVPAPTEDWLTAELAGSAWFVDVEERRFRRAVPYPAQRYIRLLTTFSRHRMLPPDQRERLHTGIAEVLDAHGGVLDVQLDTVLALGRRADQPACRAELSVPPARKGAVIHVYGGMRWLPRGRPSGGCPRRTSTGSARLWPPGGGQR